MSCRDLRFGQGPSQSSASSGTGLVIHSDSTGSPDPNPHPPPTYLPLPAVCVCQEAHEQGINAVKFSATSDLLATGGTDRVVKLWDVRAGSSAFLLSPDVVT